jgi:outer membrane receptor protein involved in Fe transport
VTGRFEHPVPAQDSVHVFVSQRIGRGLSAFLNIENLTDSQDPNTGVLLPTGAAAAIYRPDAGRTARVGVQWSFSAR